MGQDLTRRLFLKTTIGLIAITNFFPNEKNPKKDYNPKIKEHRDNPKNYNPIINNKLP